MKTINLALRRHQGHHQDNPHTLDPHPALTPAEGGAAQFVANYISSVMSSGGLDHEHPECLDPLHYDSKSNKGRGAVYKVLRQLVPIGDICAPWKFFGSKVRKINEMNRRTLCII